MTILKLVIMILAAANASKVGLAAPCSMDTCAKKWNRCGGLWRENSGWSTSTRFGRRCCDPDFHCVQFSSTYAQCRPKKRIIPQSWSGDILVCEAASPAQLPQVITLDGACGAQVGSCAGPYPCCSAEGKCGCTKNACNEGCQAMYGDCIPWTPDSEWTLPSDDDVKNMDDGSTPVTGKLDICSDPWIMTAVSENNKLRSEVGTSLVICDEDAARVAKVWSQEMCKQGKLSHDGFSTRCQELGWGWCAENVLYNFDTSRKAASASVEQWYKSPPHKRNMMNGLYAKVGFGYEICADGRVYWTGMYGK